LSAGSLDPAGSITASFLDQLAIIIIKHKEPINLLNRWRPIKSAKRSSLRNHHEINITSTLDVHKQQRYAQDKQ
jgi:hypothetical protein